MSPQRVSANEMIGLAVDLAQRWKVLTLPPDTVVSVANFKFRRGRPVGQPGVIAFRPQPRTPKGVLDMQGCSFDPAGATVSDMLGEFIEWLQGEVDSRAAKG